MLDCKLRIVTKIVEDKPAGKLYIQNQSMEGVREVEYFSVNYIKKKQEIDHEVHLLHIAHPEEHAGNFG